TTRPRPPPQPRAREDRRKEPSPPPPFRGVNEEAEINRFGNPPTDSVRSDTPRNVQTTSNPAVIRTIQDDRIEARSASASRAESEALYAAALFASRDRFMARQPRARRFRGPFA